MGPLFETPQVLLIVHEHDVEGYECLCRIHSSNPRVRVILDRRRTNRRRRHAPAAGGERRVADRRTPEARDWKGGHLVVEIGFA